ncbi:Re/Si-specific NAD(P)(+) transhydrogenase subunit alpha [Leptospira sp. GIMC2001]|uniref:Re/Si-specific NAD(P)(+) transhydrogenase subunit alpha n=1 Tax=Leptospira sp. GIMC2001 TaxID=1513297 RepID=UPI0004A5C494|nr:Re/Si-specific NAD(P)(+) transhydrogenase subunit alpha [Leptospira sp. GIMC2001]AID56155.1 NADP transhydrogenase alpha subunit [Leptospira sp. GIMC2001]WCL48967.1 Re/Si-specific NAD(P)(+) transhydrogenase subunit alpha [Leptospira sp. GIMC2001]
MQLGIIKEESFENRVSITPDVIDALKKIGIEVIIETGAGDRAFHSDDQYKAAGATVGSRSEVLSKSDLITCVQFPTEEVSSALKKGQSLMSLFQPVYNKDKIAKLNSQGLTLYSLDTIPRITRAQSMDVLSSQATVAGYKAVLLAATSLSRFFPMLTTAAGTITPTRMLIIGAGVAGLQAIATARRLGAVVDVFDTRPEVKEQVMSLGAKFVEVEGAADASQAGGYAVEQSDEYKQRQAEAIHKFASKADVIITTALIPGKPAPKLIAKATVEEMRPGSVIVDLASIMGGNCELTVDNQTINHKGVSIIGNSNLPSTMPSDASKMFAKNILNFLKLLMKENQVNLDFNDEVIAGTCIAHNGEITHKPTKAALGE